MTHEELLYASPEDIAFFKKCIEGLPKQEGDKGDGVGADGVPLPFSCGPHSVRCLREIVEIVKPKAILEIGFNIGRSASMWLELSEARVESLDISQKFETIQAARFLTQKYDDRFEFNFRNHFLLDIDYFDLIFIDGGHEFDDVVTDIRLAIDLKIPYLAFDDILPEYGPGVQPAIDYFKEELEHVKTMGNIALYKLK